VPPIVFQAAPVLNHTYSLPTPIKFDKLLFHLQASRYDVDRTDYLVNGFKSGFRLGTEVDIPFIPHSATTKRLQHEDVILDKLEQEIQLERVAGPFRDPPLSNFRVSPIKACPKKAPNKYRVIHDLSFPYDDTSVNAVIPFECKTVKYSSIHDAICYLIDMPSGSHMAKVDLKDAFRLVPMHPSEYLN